MRRHIFHLMSLAVITFLLSACSGDVPSPGQSPVRSTFSIVAGDASRPDDTGNLAPSPDTENELIGSWWIVFANKSTRKVYSIVSRPSGLVSAVEEESVEADLPADTYLVYAFANITKEEFEENTGLRFETGAPLPEGIDSGIWRSLKNAPGRDIPIPMSGFREITVTGKVTEPFAIEVVRMLAKIEFCFMNESGSGITVKSVTFAPLNNGAVPLLPTFDPSMAPSILEGCDTELVTVMAGNGTGGLAVPDGTQIPVRDRFYVRESVAESHPTGHFHFSLLIEREGRGEEEELYALTDELLFINRNDYIQIPVLFADLSLEVEVRFYPPIGGYPAVELHGDKDEYYIEFGTSGGFSINPRFTDNTTGAAIAGKDVKVKVVSVSDPSQIFERAPSVETSGEITGVLSSAVGGGTAEVSLSMEVKSGEVKRVYYRKVYIIRK